MFRIASTLKINEIIEKIDVMEKLNDIAAL